MTVPGADTGDWGVHPSNKMLHEAFSGVRTNIRVQMVRLGELGKRNRGLLPSLYPIPQPEYEAAKLTGYKEGTGSGTNSEVDLGRLWLVPLSPLPGKHTKVCPFP